MCWAIVKIKHRVGEASTITVESESELEERIAKLRQNDETLEYRVYLAQPKQVRTSVWEQQP
jgi:hypothetical protein